MCYSYISGVEIMRKTFRFSLLILSVSFLLVACGDKEEAPDASNPDEEVIRTVEVGEEYSNKHGVFTVVKGSTEVVETDGGPAKLWIDKAVASSGMVEGSFVEIIGKEEIEIIQLEMNIENVSDEVISLPLGKATLITNTGEEIEESDTLMSEFVQDKVYPGVRFNGTFTYILEEAKAEDIDSIIVRWPAAEDENGEEVGNEAEVEINF